MQYPKPVVLVVSVLLGMLLSAIGMLGYTGLIRIPFAWCILLAGYALMIGGSVVICLDMKERGGLYDNIAFRPKSGSKRI